MLYKVALVGWEIMWTGSHLKVRAPTSHVQTLHVRALQVVVIESFMEPLARNALIVCFTQHHTFVFDHILQTSLAAWDPRLDLGLKHPSLLSSVIVNIEP